MEAEKKDKQKVEFEKKLVEREIKEEEEKKKKEEEDGMFTFESFTKITTGKSSKVSPFCFYRCLDDIKR